MRAGNTIRAGAATAVGDGAEEGTGEGTAGVSAGPPQPAKTMTAPINPPRRMIEPSEENARLTTHNSKLQVTDTTGL
jgi:hypothetical protein